MKQIITLSKFCDAFKNMNREDQFSYDAKKALFDNFRPGTPCDSIARIHKICSRLQESGFRLPMGRDAYDLPLINEIQGNHVSGWIPFTMGGFSVTQLIDHGMYYPMCESECDAYEDEPELEPSILEFRIWINKDLSIEWDYRVDDHLIKEGKLRK